MKKEFLYVLLFLMLIASDLSAQNIYFCSSYTEKGEPLGASKSWTLEKNGGYIYILFNNHKKHIKAKSLLVQLMKKSGPQYLKYEKRAMELHVDNNWAVLDYQFTEAGNYEAIVQDKTGKELASDFVTIKLIAKTEDSVVLSPTSGTNPERNYSHAKTIFCKSILNGTPVDTGSVFLTGDVNVIMTNNKPFDTDSIIVDIFKKGYESEKYRIYITTKNLSINRDLSTALFSLTFDETGQYKVVIYNSLSQMITTSYISIH